MRQNGHFALNDPYYALVKLAGQFAHYVISDDIGLELGLGLGVVDALIG